MRAVAVLISIIVFAGCLFAQDGSNIRYLRPGELKDSHIGRTIQIDFYNKSFLIDRRSPKNSQVNLDKVFLDINGKQIEFLEHREDDGYNNWFSEQFLESLDKKIKVTEFKLLKIEKDTISVLGYFTVDPFSKEFSFNKKDIAEILIKSDG